MSWLDEAVPSVRLIIGDVDAEPLYTDDRICQSLIMAAKYVKMEMSFDAEYSISALTLSVTPDPLEEDDYEFINFCVLKAACILDTATFRQKSLLEGINVGCGPANISIAGHLKGFERLMQIGPCKAYDDLKKQYLFSKRLPVRGILSPFVSNDFDPKYMLNWCRSNGGGLFF